MVRYLIYYIAIVIITVMRFEFQGELNEFEQGPVIGWEIFYHRN